MSALIILLFIVFLLGGYFCVSTSSSNTLESFTNKAKSRCPNLLIQKGCRIYLKNTDIAEVPGVNPIEFENLGEYVIFMNWQRRQGITCPVLFFQQSYDSQGNEVYKVQPSPTELQGGLPPSSSTKQQYNQNTSLINANQDNSPYNQGGAESYDPTNLYIGEKTPLDAINEKDQGMLHSANAMDPNWGGAKYTEAQITAGKYKANEVSIQVN